MRHFESGVTCQSSLDKAGFLIYFLGERAEIINITGACSTVYIRREEGQPGSFQENKRLRRAFLIKKE